MRKSIAFLIAATSLGLAAQAPAATTFDVVAGYNTAPYSYGSGTGGSTFTAFALNFASGCQSRATFACHADSSQFNLPVVGRNTGPGTITFATVSLPNNVLFFHPGQVTAQDAIMRFTAATAGQYTLNGNFIRLDSTLTPNGGQDGILASIFRVSGSAYSSLYSNTLVGAQNSSIAFAGLSTTLAAGDHLEFVVNRRSAFNTDGTGLQATITTNAIQSAVPEPATWAMMLLGFGVIGSALRRRRTTKPSFI